MAKEPLQPQDKYVLRLPNGMRDRIKAAAEANNRSMNAEIVARLEATLDGKAEKKLLEFAVQAATTQARYDVIDESFQLTVGILAEASGNDKRTRELLAQAIRAQGDKDISQLSETRQKTIERLAEQISGGRPEKNELGDTNKDDAS